MKMPKEKPSSTLEKLRAKIVLADAIIAAYKSGDPWTLAEKLAEYEKIEVV